MKKNKTKIIKEPEGITFYVENRKPTPQEEKLLREIILKGRKKTRMRTKKVEA